MAKILTFLETTQIFDELDSNDGAIILPRSRDGFVYVPLLLGKQTEAVH